MTVFHRFARATFAIAAGIVAAPAGAQQAQGAIVAACGTLGPSRTLAVPVTAAVPAGRTIVLAIGARDAAPAGLVVTDAAGSAYAPVGGARKRAQGGAVALLVARTTGALPAGSTLTIASAQAPTAAPLCVAGAAFVDVVGSHAGLRARGAATGPDAAPTVAFTRSDAGVPALAFAGFVFAADPGSVGAPATIDTAPTACTVDHALCLVGAWSLDAAGTGDGIAVTTGGATTWRGVIARLPRDSLFRDGYD